ncbi:hypothetical protein Tco_0417044 [Tanacetum coccineum]
MVNESLTAELERYKERIAIFEQRLNVDLNKREKLIDSQMDDLIRDRNASLRPFVRNKEVRPTKPKSTVHRTVHRTQTTTQDLFIHISYKMATTDKESRPQAAATFMANLMQTGPSTGQGTIHGGEQLDSDVDSVIDDHDNIILYHQYQLNNEVKSVPTDVSFVIPGGISVTILDDLSRAAVPKKPKVLAPGLYAMTPKYIPPQKRNNREANTPLPKEREVASTKPHHMIAPGSSRYSSNDMVHNHYLEEAKNRNHEIVESKTSEDTFC